MFTCVLHLLRYFGFEEVILGKTIVAIQPPLRICCLQCFAVILMAKTRTCNFLFKHVKYADVIIAVIALCRLHGESLEGEPCCCACSFKIQGKNKIKCTYTLTILQDDLRLQGQQEIDVLFKNKIVVAVITA